MLKNNLLKYGVGLTMGLAQALGFGAGMEIVKIFQAADPLYEVRMKVKQDANKRRFEHIMAQTDLKSEQA